MNVAQTTGHILRVRPYSDTTLIIHWLTPDLGRLATIAKGARRPKSPFRGQLDLFYLAQFSFARSARSDLHTLREVKTLETYSGLRADLAYVRQASYAAALIEQTTETESPLPILASLFGQLLSTLPLHPPHPQTIFAFELKLLADLGLAPEPSAAPLTPGSRQILQKLLDLNLSDSPRLHPTPAQTTEIHHFLDHFLACHLGKIPQARYSATA